MRRFLCQLRLAKSTSDQEGKLTVPNEIVALDRYSLCGLKGLNKLYALGLDILERNIPGDIVECGVYNGGSAASIACAFRSTQRKIWLYDSFAGLPEVTEKDGPEAARYVKAFVGSEDLVWECLRIARFPKEQVIIRKGWFKDTFQLPLPETVSLLHIDADWYDSVMLSLNTFYDRVPEGGTIVLDDFGGWEGCREAFYEFCVQRGIKPLLERFGHTAVFWVKGRMHNRIFQGKWEIP